MKMILTATVVGTVLALTSAASAVELRLGMQAPAGHKWVAAMERLQEELAARPEADVTIALFPGAQLGAEAELLQQVESGLLDMAVFTLPALSTREEAVNAWFTPYLFGSVEEAAAARTLPAARQMLDNLSDSGMVGLGYVFAGMRHILTRDTPVETAADLEGLKIRITPFPAAQTWWEALGAIPTPIPLPGVYQALQSGVVDGVDIDLDAIASSSLQEVGHNLTITSHMAFPGALVASQTSWDSLTDAQRQAITESVEIAVQYGIEESIAKDASVLEDLRDQMTVLEIENGEDAFAPANEAFAEMFAGNELIAQFQSEAAAQ